MWQGIENSLYRGREYNLHIPFGQRTYTPWFCPPGESLFATLLADVRGAGPVGVAPDRCYLLHSLCRSSLSTGGAVAECGVFTGGTAHLLAGTIAAEPEQRAFHLFDTFTGMPDTADPARDYHRPGDFAETSLEFVRRRLSAFPFCELHPGTIPDTFAQVATVEPYSFVHVDVDIHDSVLACCAWFWPRLAPGGIMVFDDYGFYVYRYAARAAVDKFFSSEPVDPVVLPTGQAFIIKPA